VRDSPELVDLVVRVSPPSATISIDGLAVPTNPFHARYGKDSVVHHVLLSAPGYDAKLEDVSFANDVAIDVSLDRRQATVSATSPAPPPRFVPVPSARAARRGAASASAPSPSAEASAPTSRSDVAPGGGRVPLRPIATSNPYGNP
jgi:serine/threonine-protein kinase